MRLQPSTRGIRRRRSRSPMTRSQWRSTPASRAIVRMDSNPRPHDYESCSAVSTADQRTRGREIPAKGGVWALAARRHRDEVQMFLTPGRAAPRPWKRERQARSQAAACRALQAPRRAEASPLLLPRSNGTARGSEVRTEPAEDDETFPYAQDRRVPVAPPVKSRTRGAPCAAAALL